MENKMNNNLIHCLTTLKTLLSTTDIKLSQLQEISVEVKELIPNKYSFDEQKYPRLGFTLSYDDLVPFLKENNTIATAFYFEQATQDNPFAKLLYATLWKNGDIIKIKHIVNGIQDISRQNGIRQGSANNGWVFYQFGRHLADPKEPIVDQHTIRAYKILTQDINFENVYKATYVSRDNLIAYCKWIKLIKFSNSEKTECQHLLDKILFTLGKAAKNIN